MTAYGKGDFETSGKHFSVEIKSVNNRYRDVVMRLPRNLQACEQQLRPMLEAEIKRGRIEVFFQLENEAETAPYGLELNLPLAKAYLEVFSQLSQLSGMDQQLRVETLLQMKDVVAVKADPGDDEEIVHGFQKALGIALKSLVEMRSREGHAIDTDFKKRLEKLARFVKLVRDAKGNIVDHYHNRLMENVSRLSEGADPDPERIAQEVALFADRCDITEELVRLESHLQQFYRYLETDDAVGRRLDFLIQEMNREVNTLSSKASDANVSKQVVEMKAELEKLREQVQNVE